MIAPASSPAILDLLHRRTSARAIDPVPIEDSDLLALLEAVRWAPSWGNLQPWRLVVARSVEARSAVGAALTSGNRWALRAPVLIVVAADPADAKQRDDGSSSYAFDCGLATECLLLEAARRGLVAHPMGGWDEAGVRSAIGAPEAVRIAVVIAVGRPGDPADLDERTREKETRARTRKPLSSIAFADRWGGSIEESTGDHGDEH
jgi:nitroreductase